MALLRRFFSLKTMAANRKLTMTLPIIETTEIIAPGRDKA